MNTNEYKILILGDVATDAELMEYELKKGGLNFVSRRVQSREDFLSALNAFAPDIVLSDYNLPQFDGLLALQLSREKRPDTPFIFVTGALGDELAVETLKNGAEDYLLKTKLSQQLVPTVQRALRNIESIAQEKEIERAKTDFITLISHQLRTPLSGTRWLIETLKNEIAGPLTVKQKEYIDQVEQINERMLKLVMSILHARSFESGASVIKKEYISIVPFFEKVSQMMKFVAAKKEITLLERYHDRKEINTESDETMLSAIIETLIENAIDYSSKGQEVVLDVSEDPLNVIFSVSDTGAGIPPEEAHRIFERFYRTSNAKILKPEGTGLALYVASLLAKKIDGNISFESNKQGGSTFYLSIPKSGHSQKLDKY